MLTLFTTAKPFRGHTAIIQRNALMSWTSLHLPKEIIVFGDQDGSAGVCAELSLRHEQNVERTEFGTNRVDYMFARAQAIARHDVLCYINCDIILQDDFCNALRQAKAAHPEFLMVGRRWDVDITEPIDFSSPNWRTETRERALTANHQRDAWWIDYFAFSRGLYGADVPPFGIGRISWDDWLVWKVIDSGRPVIDASAVVIPVHQNHDYNHHPQGQQGVWRGEESKRNFELSGGWGHLRTIEDATELLTPNGLKPNPHRYWLAAKRQTASVGRFLLYRLWNPIWFLLLDLTRPLRGALGLRTGATRRSREKI